MLRSLRTPEKAILKSSLGDLIAFYQGHPEEAKALITVGDTPASTAIPPQKLAAWTMLANQVLNLDETLNK